MLGPNGSGREEAIDGGTLYITANDRLCRVRTGTKGLGF